MNDLINIINAGGKLVVSSREIAEHFEKRHSDVTKAIEDLINKEGYAEKVADLYQMFICSEYKNEQNGQFYKEYLLTRDGFSLLVMGFTGQKALEWKLKYIEAFNKMERTLKEQKNSMSLEDIMILQLEEQKKIKNRLQVVENKVENQMTLDYGQQRVIQREVAKRVYKRMEYYLKEVYFTDEKAKKMSNLVDIKHTDIFKGTIKKYFNSLYKDLKNRFGVPSYRDIKKRDYNLAINYICNWIEPQELREAS